MSRRPLLAALALLALLSTVAAAQTPARARLFTRLADGVVRAAIRIEIDPRWHIYHAELGHPKAVGQPTKLTFTGEGIEWGDVRFPEPIDTSTSHVGFRCIVRPAKAQG